MKAVIQALLSKLNVTNEEFHVVSDNLYRRLENGGDLSIVVGEAYMAGEWKSSDLTAFLRKVLTRDNYNSHLFSVVLSDPISAMRVLTNVVTEEIRTDLDNVLQNNQSIPLSKRVAETHYDNTPDILYKYMLDSHRQYTSGYWKPGTKTLEVAQEDKMKLLIDKLQIPDGAEMNVLDIGCGWGDLANMISKRYPKCNVIAINIAKDQLAAARSKHGESEKLKYVLSDYRDLPKLHMKFDRIVSVEMFEHVGPKNYNMYFKTCNDILNDQGIFVLQTMSTPIPATSLFGNQHNFADPWIEKHIFPGGVIPTQEQIITSSTSQEFVHHHSQNISASYVKTLRHWHDNIKSNWETIRMSDPKYFTSSTYNMWEFYLLGCMVAFEIGKVEDWQFVLTKRTYDGMYVFTEKE